MRRFVTSFFFNRHEVGCFKYVTFCDGDSVEEGGGGSTPCGGPLFFYSTYLNLVQILISRFLQLTRNILYIWGQGKGENYLHHYQSCSIQYIFFGVQRKGQGDSDGLVLALFSIISLCRGSPRNAGFRKMYF